MKPLIVITGPTASGKTKLAAHVAKACDGEIISADSRQVFRHMNIGTGKDYQDYFVDGVKIPYHLIDIKEAGEEYSVAEFMEDFHEVLELLHARNKQAILCGGTGFYIQGALEGFERTLVPPDETFRAEAQVWSKEKLKSELEKYPILDKIDFHSSKRLIRAIEIARFQQQFGSPEKRKEKISHVIYALDLPREIRRERISTRLKIRLEEGLVEEVQGLLANGVSTEKLIRYGLEYKFTCEFLQGKYTQDQFVELLEIGIHQYAKRQMTWFRKMEKDGYQIHWLNALEPTEKLVQQILG